MKTIAIVSQKGGAGKTTIALHLAVAAEAHELTSAVFDLDPQGSAIVWNDHRTAAAPAVVAAQAPRLLRLLDEARKQNARFVFLDTAPHNNNVAAEAAAHADLVLIPCRPSALDLDAVSTSVRMARLAEKRAFIILSCAPPQGREATEAAAAIAASGVEVCPVVLHQRKVFSSHMNQGLTATEVEPRGKGAAEVNALLDWLLKVTR